MRTLSYSPSVEIYACVVGRNGSKRYLDLSQDVISCNVSLKTNAASTFSFSLMNEGGKYTNVFTPMDLVSIFANKGAEREKILTGYMVNVSRFTLFPKDFSISGYDALYRIQNVYWDPGLDTSVELMSNESSGDRNWTGYAGEATKLMTTVGGVPADSIVIGDIPDDVIGLAKKIYDGQASDISLVDSTAEDFYDMIKSSSNIAYEATLKAQGNSNTTEHMGTSSGPMTEQQSRLVKSAYDTPFRGTGMCAAWVYNVYANAGLTYSPSGNANDLYRMYCNTSDVNMLKPGMLVAVESIVGGTSAGIKYGHVGIYVGNGKVRHNTGNYVHEDSLEEFIRIYGSASYPVKWGFPPNISG